MSGGFLRLDDLAVIRVQGTAARDFLGRQLTCDLAALTPGNPLFGAWLTPKGRTLTLLHLVDRGDDGLRMLIPAELVDGVLKRLAMFVMRDDVQLQPDDDAVVFGLCDDAVGLAPSGAPGLALAPLQGPMLAYGLCREGDAQRLHAHLLANGCDALRAEDWTLLLIRAGIPQVVAATQDLFVPQMINLDRLGAVSFEKGCYPGQEIVARTQHLGRIKRRTYIGHCAAASPRAEPGDVLVTDDGNAVGKVVSSALHDAGQDLLAVVSLEAAAGDATLRLGDRDGPPVRIAAPSYL